MTAAIKTALMMANEILNVLVLLIIHLVLFKECIDE